MKHSFLDQYSDRNSPAHRLDPRTKLLAALAFILLLLVTPVRWPFFFIYLAFIILAVMVSRLPVLFVLKRSLVVVPFVLLVGIFLPFLKEGEIAGSLNIGLWRISFTHEGLQALAGILGRSWLSILALVWLTSTTKLNHLLQGLERLYLPRVLVMTLSFMYRYLFILVDELMRMKQARDSRNFGGKRLWQLRTLGNMIGILFVRSYERGERVYAAMAARGFDGQSRTLRQLGFRRLDLYFGLAFSLVFALAIIFSFLY